MNQNLNDESKSVECISKSNPILTISMSKEAKIVIRTEFSTSLQVLEILMANLLTRNCKKYSLISVICRALL